jgi:hypothetical protein
MEAASLPLPPETEPSMPAVFFFGKPAIVRVKKRFRFIGTNPELQSLPA